MPSRAPGRAPKLAKKNYLRFIDSNSKTQLGAFSRIERSNFNWGSTEQKNNEKKCTKKKKYEITENKQNLQK